MQPREHTSEHVFLGMTAVIVSEPMQRLLDLVARVARSGASVLVMGESGSGKEMVARAIHYFSGRSQRPWVDLSCAALPEQLLESELFGHEKGAFSGADTPKPGLFELAHQGTIFLDEIGELDPRMQVKLLRVLDGVPYYRLGGVRKVSVDVRVVAATNQNLEQAVAEGRFRGDLFHRLNQVALCVPPLRARVDDIEPLARHFLALHDPAFRLSESAVSLLRRHNWPGNIRELRNTLVQAAVMARDSVLTAEDFQSRPFGMQSSPGPVALPSQARPAMASRNAGMDAANGSIQSMEKRLILDALASTNGHQQKAAAQLGISRRTLSRKLKLYQETAEVAS